ncbi:MAG: hypothetical protein LBJ67_09385 [Planctomycetaceae bacterium]|jgi:hypothetical protein|nr:hypothetical protein [Planctomycetaceae bacterium]
MEIWYRSPIKKPTSFVLGGSQKKLFTFCWYKENEIICFVGNSWEIFRFTAKGERSLFQIFYDDDDRNKNKCIERKLFNDEKGNIYLLDVRVLAEKNKNSSTINTNQAFGMQGVLFLLDPKSNEFKCYSDPHIVASLSGSLCGNAANNSSWIAAIMGGKYGFSVIDVNNVDNRKNICLNNFPEHVVSYYPALTPDNSFVVCCLKTTEPSMVEYYGINKVPPRPMFNLVMFLLQ